MKNRERKEKVTERGEGERGERRDRERREEREREECYISREIWREIYREKDTEEYREKLNSLHMLYITPFEYGYKRNIYCKLKA